MSHWIEQYLGIKWATGGREVAMGLDCWGLLRHVYQHQFGITLNKHPVPRGALAHSTAVAIVELSTRQWVEVKIPEDGDVVALGKDNKQFSHVGVMLNCSGELNVLHIRHGITSVLVPLNSLREEGWVSFKFYHHVDRPIHN